MMSVLSTGVVVDKRHIITRIEMVVRVQLVFQQWLNNVSMGWLFHSYTHSSNFLITWKYSDGLVGLEGMDGWWCIISKAFVKGSISG